MKKGNVIERPTNEKIERARSQAATFKGKLAEVQADLAEVQGDNAGLLTVIEDKNRTINRLENHLTSAQDQNKYLGTMREAIVESLLQEHAELVGRMTRVEARLKAMGAPLVHSFMADVMKKPVETTRTIPVRLDFIPTPKSLGE